MFGKVETWKGAVSRKAQVLRPCDCGCDQRDGTVGVGYLTASDENGNGYTQWITDENAYLALEATINAHNTED